MSYQCDICHKGLMRGNLVSHSKQRMHRLYKPNLHTAKAIINGATKNVRVCTKCLRKIKRPEKKEIAKVEIKKKIIAEVPAEVKEIAIKQPAEVQVKETTVEELMKESSFAKATEDKEAGKEEKKEPVKKKRGRQKKLNK